MKASLLDRFTMLLALGLCLGLGSAVTADLVGAWTFNEGAGNVVRDRSGQGHHGAIIGAQWFSPGWDGTGHCLLFDGQGSNRVDLGAFDVVGPGITVTSWSNAYDLEQGPDPRLISKANGGAGEAHWWATGSCRVGAEKRIRFRLKTDGVTAEIQSGPAGTIELNEWIHIAATWDGAMMQTYKNGVQVHSLAKGGTISTDPSVSVAIGNQPQGAEDRPWHGLIDDVRVYSRALSVEEIQDVMLGMGLETELASDPRPAVGALDVWRDTLLSWTAGEFAATHDVYFGTSFDDINEIGRAHV